MATINQIFRCASVFCFAWSRVYLIFRSPVLRMVPDLVLLLAFLPHLTAGFILPIFPGLVVGCIFFPFPLLDGCCDWFQSFPSILCCFSRISVWSVFAAATGSWWKICAFAQIVFVWISVEQIFECSGFAIQYHSSKEWLLFGTDFGLDRILMMRGRISLMFVSICIPSV